MYHARGRIFAVRFYDKDSEFKISFCSHIALILFILAGDFTINIDVIGNLAALYQAVDHSTDHENKYFSGDQRAIDICPYPMPEKYTLRMQNHKVSK